LQQLRATLIKLGSSFGLSDAGLTVSGFARFKVGA
jgi:hypothetical protein